MSHSGHRDNPAVIDSPGALDRAVCRVWDPTSGQAEAGNYQKAHVIVGGLDVTIETPLDRMRRGIGPDGKPWSVRMPAHYGYVKRTEGADGDHVDVYVGPEAHRTHLLPVYVIDQVDANTGSYDEHKCLLGFGNKVDAGSAYLAAFSDGRGRERIGAVTVMSFQEFKEWLDHGDTTRPMRFRQVEKSVRSMTLPALGCGCGASDTPCRCQFGGSGGHMPAEQTDTSPRGVNLISKTLSAIWPKLSKAEREDLVKDAAVTANLELGKATDLLEMGDDHERPGKVEDLFDGPPDDRLKTKPAGGPDSHIPGGSVGIGPSQDASGAGADRMEREYSRPAPQSGVQRATEELGKKLRAHGAALKSIIGFGDAMGRRLAMLESTMAVSPTAMAVDKEAIDAAIAKTLPGMVSAAVAKALPQIVSAVIKAKKGGETEDDKEDDKETTSGHETEEEEDDEEADQEEKGPAENEIEIVNELEGEEEDEADDDEGKKAAKKAAARERVIAKGLLRLARKAAAESHDAMEDERPAAAMRHHKKAERRMRKARLHLAIAKALRSGVAGPNTLAVEKSLGAVSKSIKEMRAKNQDKWPTSKEARPGTGKSETQVASQQSVQNDEVAKATHAVQEALKGMALLNGKVEDLMRAVAGQSRDPGSTGSTPVSELFKGDVVHLGSKEAQIKALAHSRTITQAECDKAMDALSTMKMPNLPQVMIEAQISACPAPVQEILRRAA